MRAVRASGALHARVRFAARSHVVLTAACPLAGGPAMRAASLAFGVGVGVGMSVQSMRTSTTLSAAGAEKTRALQQKSVELVRSALGRLRVAVQDWRNQEKNPEQRATVDTAAPTPAPTLSSPTPSTTPSAGERPRE